MMNLRTKASRAAPTTSNKAHTRRHDGWRLIVASPRLHKT